MCYKVTMDHMYINNSEANKALYDNFNLTRKENCCDCISIVLYLQKCSKEELYKYLESINKTVKIVRENLKDFLIRIYFDISVYNCVHKPEIPLHDLGTLIGFYFNKGKTEMGSKIIENQHTINNIIKDDITIILKEIIDSPNVEIYTYVCEENINKDITMTSKRTLRYLSLIDDNTNINIIREADGIISNLDCFNIKLFQKSTKLFYIPYLLGGELDKKLVRTRESYSLWLQMYKILNRESSIFFNNHVNITDLLAGLFGTRLKPKKEYYYSTYHNVYNWINNFANINKNNVNSLFSHFPISKQDTILQSHSILIHFINIGFDEIFLLELYKEMVSIPVNIINNTIIQDDLLFKGKVNMGIGIYSTHNINQYVYYERKIKESFKIDGNLDVNEEINKIEIAQYIIKNLYDLKIIKRYVRLPYNDFPGYQYLKHIKILGSENINIMNLVDSSLTMENINQVKCPFNVIYYPEKEPFPISILGLLNKPYEQVHDIYYNLLKDVQLGGEDEYYYKYLKYKHKYLALKKYING